MGLILSIPLALGTMIAIRLDSKGPVIYRQERVGQSGKIFVIYKFRSMVESAESESGPVWSQQGDPRVTRVGDFLRKSRLDEIPQMWNVLKGDMSFVGPRPERPHFVKQLRGELPFYDERHNVKPGITDGLKFAILMGLPCLPPWKSLTMICITSNMPAWAWTS